jgi:AraC family transcriptional regulator
MTEMTLYADDLRQVRGMERDITDFEGEVDRLTQLIVEVEVGADGQIHGVGASELADIGNVGLLKAFGVGLPNGLKLLEFQLPGAGIVAKLQPLAAHATCDGEQRRSGKGAKKDSDWNASLKRDLQAGDGPCQGDRKQDAKDGRCEARTNLHRPAALERQLPNHISFVPAEMKVWGYTDNTESVRELRLSFDRKSLGDWFGPDLDPGKAGNPQLMFHDKRAVECARLLAAECDASDPGTGLYGEGLAIALLSACFQGRPQKENSGLSVSQFRLVLDFIHEHLDLSVSVFQLARLVDLSSSQFARMFKASPGASPHRYQLNTRIGKAQELLLMKGESLSMVAAATGFADQSHFTRTFKRVTGATPHEWHQNRIP